MSRVALVTGASSGIGADIAQTLNKAGYSVYAAARRIDNMKLLDESGITPVFLDLTDDTSIVSCVNTVMESAGHIDLLVNNAGYGSYGAIEDVPLDEARRQFDVNLFGMARLIQLVVPSMRQQRAGRIINISSMGGKIWTKFGGWYHATKFAIEGLSDCLRMKLKPFGIDVVVVEPGGIRTDWGLIAAEHLRLSSAGGAYAAAAGEAARDMVKNYSGRMLSSPHLISKTVLKAANARRPRTRYLIGFGA